MSQVVLPSKDPIFVESLIPQKFPFVMVSQLLEYSPEKLIAAFIPSNSNIFVTNEVFQEGGLIEHMAQSVALHTGYQYFLKNEPAPTGYIGSIKSIDIFNLPKVGETIETHVFILQEFGGITLVDIQSFCNGIEIAKGQMKTVIA